MQKMHDEDKKIYRLKIRSKKTRTYKRKPYFQKQIYLPADFPLSGEGIYRIETVYEEHDRIQYYIEFEPMDVEETFIDKYNKRLKELQS